MYLFGGFGGFGGSNDVNTICKFNTKTEKIGTLSAKLPQALSNMGVAQIGSNVYLFGGLKTSISKLPDVYKFEVDF